MNKFVSEQTKNPIAFSASWIGILYSLVSQL